MNHCKNCGNNIPDTVNTCEEAGFGEGCGKKFADTINTDTICSECEMSQYLCNLLQDIVYEEDTAKRRLMAARFRKEYRFRKEHEARTI
jgi:hypothetical protein